MIDKSKLELLYEEHDKIISVLADIQHRCKKCETGQCQLCEMTTQREIQRDMLTDICHAIAKMVRDTVLKEHKEPSPVREECNTIKEELNRLKGIENELHETNRNLQNLIKAIERRK